MRPWVLLLIALLAGCKGPPPRVASDGLAGSWRNSEGVSLTCEDTGILVLEVPGPKPKPIIGEYTFDGEVATFRYRQESKQCVDDTGVYTITLSAGEFSATAVRETCALREAMLKGIWTRTAAARVTLGSM